MCGNIKKKEETLKVVYSPEVYKDLTGDNYLKNVPDTLNALWNDPTRLSVNSLLMLKNYICDTETDYENALDRLIQSFDEEFTEVANKITRAE